jgi:hypothetical protein
MRILALTMSLLFAFAVSSPFFVSEAIAQQGTTKPSSAKQTPKKRPCPPGARRACY